MKTIQQHIDAVSARHDVIAPAVREMKGGRYRMEMDGIPILPWFIDLATELLIPIKDIEVSHTQGTDGCDTCGYGGECEFEIIIHMHGGRR